MKKMIFMLLALSLIQPTSAMFQKLHAYKLEKLNQRLQDSIYLNNLEEARECLAQGADVHAQDKAGYTALMLEIQKSNEEISEEFCKLLIQKTINFELKNSDEMTALVLAISWKHLTICKLLIAAGARVNAPDKSRHIPLINAACRDKVICKLLLEAKANIHGKNNNGCTALHYAVRQLSRGSSKMLIAAHADVNAQDNEKNTPLLTAAGFAGANQCALLLANGANPYSRNERDQTALMIATQLIDGRDTCKALITKSLFLPHRTAAQLHESRQRIITALWALKLACPTLPRDLKYKILLTNNELQLDTFNCPFKIHAHQYDHLPYMPLQNIRTLLNATLLESEKTVSWLKKNCYKCLEPLLREAYDSMRDNDYDSDKVWVFKEILHPDTIDAVHGSEIEKNIRMNLGLE
jgi:ankyrin repeat protein